MGVISKGNNVVIRNDFGYQYGIEHQNNTLYNSYSFKQLGIVENIVSSNTTATNPNSYAIRSVQNTNYAVVCNTVANTYNGVAFSGVHINNAFVRFNNMNKNHYGFVLENSGVIGQQGQLYPDGSAAFADNQWLGTWTAPNFKTATLNSLANLSKMCVRNTTAFNPNGSGFTNGLSAGSAYSIPDGTILTASVEGTFYNCFLGKPAPTNPNVDALEKIAASNATTGIEHAIARFVAKSQLFTYLKNNPDAVTPGILTGFYNSNKHKYRDMFFDVETDVTIGDNSNAKTKVTGFNPQNPTEAKHKQFYDILFKYQDQTMTSSDEQDLLTLANGCPYLDGIAVHQARALYNVATDQSLSFTDSCDFAPNPSSYRMANGNYDEENISNSTWLNDNVLVYPNPSVTGEVFIAVTNADLESIDVTVSNVNGLQITKETLSLVNGLAKLNIKAVSGVYMLTVTNNQTHERLIKKLVIQKQ